ncbi:transcriptional regulator NanR [Aurantimonas sp. 22II-16-19i]|uniref:transcriptional regulator NanR n=1 Tax=Aurantimonas sp. 22II-16-19i TaxID=1317114 RepID=UPI0009F7EDD8|nr:transcriptional regulator NanR [Aurantimonas sp. 22II-16-19i]ORE98424.1 transcriptional regulator NanR [Aurantimonas sp. 22II-16-19i]
MTLRIDTDEDGDRIVRRKLSDQVLDRLREMIRSRELKPGDALPSERALMERFGVGRPAVREALQSLHNSGLITITHGERSRVNAITAGTVLDQSDQIARLLLDSVPSNLEHLKQARQMFELGIVGVAADKASEADVAALRDLAAHQRALLGGDPVPFIKADMAFHARIAEIVGNPIIAAVSVAMLRWLFEYHDALLHWSNNEEITLTEHDRIVDLIAAHDREGATMMMRDHLDRATSLYAFNDEAANRPAR